MIVHPRRHARTSGCRSISLLIPCFSAASSRPSFPVRTLQRQTAAAAALMAHGYNAFDAHQASLAVMDRTITQQAQMLAYNDAWHFLLKTFLLVSPAVLVLHKPRGRASLGEMH